MIDPDTKLLLQPPAAPQRYEASLDPLEPDEQETAQALTEQMLRIAGKTYGDSGHATRSVHAKSHGLLKAELEVLPDLPAVLECLQLESQERGQPAPNGVLRIHMGLGSFVPNAVQGARELPH